VRTHFLIGFIALTALASADRILNLPIARTIGYRNVRYESFAYTNTVGNSDQFLAFSPLQSWEIEVRQQRRPLIGSRETFDFQRNLLPAFVGTSPGISVGLLDTMNNTLEGRRGFIALTFKELLEVSDSGEPGEITLGYQFGRRTSGYVGSTISISSRTRLFFEHNSLALTVGIDSEIVPKIKARIFTTENTLGFAFNYMVRF
jgi:hypothetical protein